MKTILPLPNLPKFSQWSPKIVRTLDRIRYELQDKNDDCGEFYWFAREYPRCYRYHLDCAEFRLKGIYEKYKWAHSHFAKRIQEASGTCFGLSQSNRTVYEIYWDFESFLLSINSALDILARIVGVAYKETTPPSFNKLCKRNEHGPVELLKKAQLKWVNRMKDYRDCFVHYTPVDTLLRVTADLYSNGWEVRCKLPNNPNVREILGFKYSRRVELLRYAISVYRHMTALDATVAKEINKLYRKGEFPVRTSNLFFVGSRKKPNC